MRWQDVLADPSLQNLPYKIELNEKGIIEMSPASFSHSRLQGKIAVQLSLQLGGEIFTELAIQTSQGVRVPDVAWGSESYTLMHQGELWASSAPELCIEILSPSNTAKDMLERVALFLQAGAIEVWLVEENGAISQYDSTGQISASRFPANLHHCFASH